MNKEFQRLEKNPEANIYLDLLKAILKQEPNKKTPVHYGIYGFWFKNGVAFKNSDDFDPHWKSKNFNVQE